MKYGRIIVEGWTDAYFIHQLICKRFSGLLTPQYDSPSGFRYPVEKDDQDEMFAFKGQLDPSVAVEILTNGGSSKEDVLTGLLRDESGLARQFSACIVFDADFPQRGSRAATGNGGFAKASATFAGIAAKNVGSAPGLLRHPADVFLFPNNREDGMIETLLRRMAIDKAAVYFDECWPMFMEKIRFCEAKRSLSLKTELLDYVEVRGRKIGERKCFLQNLTNDDLWDYSSPALEPLVSFLDNFIRRL